MPVIVPVMLWPHCIFLLFLLRVSFMVLVMIPVIIPVIIPVMIPVRMTVMTSFMYSGPIYYLFLFWIYVVLVMYFPFWLSYNLQVWFYTLGCRWHETTVYIWGFPCLDYSFEVLVSWDRNLSVYNQSCLWSALPYFSCFMIMLYLSSYTILVF